MKPVRLPRLWCLRLGVIGDAIIGGRKKTLRPSAGARELRGGRGEVPPTSVGESGIAAADADIPVEVGGG